VTRFNSLADQMDQLAADSDNESNVIEERIELVGADFVEGIDRVHVAVSQVKSLLESDGGKFHQGAGLTPDGIDADVYDLDQALREDLVGLTGVKVSYL
jgi:hypothetical protein